MNLRQLIERSDRVFPSHPQVVRYFPAESLESARRRLARSIERGDGPGVVIGPAGTGKSLLLQLLAAGFRERFDVVLLACATLCTRRALLQAIHFELGLEYQCRDEGQLRLSLLDQLLAGDQAVDGLLLLVDEAQALPIHLLEELRVLTNLVRGGVPRVRLVLAGLPPLEEKLAGPELASFSQRVSARCYLGNLTREETTQYVRAQLAASSIDPDQLFAADAWAVLYDATDGVPRLLNQLCDQALALAAERDLRQIDRALIQTAWAELQQLPMPWDAPAEGASSATGEASVIEFGSLDAEDRPADVPNDVAAAEPLVPVTGAVTAAPLDIDPPAHEELEVVEPTVLDEEDEPVETAMLGGRGSRRAEDSHGEARPEPRPPAPPAVSPPRRPRVFGGCVPEAIDPFQDDFEEEELVLESFAALSGIFHAQTPQVENRRNPAFARLLDQALRSAAVMNTGRDEPEPKGGMPSLAPKCSREALGPQRECGHVPASREHATQPSIRLALVAESTLHDSEQFAPPTAAAAGEEADLDDQSPQFGDVIISRCPSPPSSARVPEPTSAVTTFAAPCVAGTVSQETDLRGSDTDAILVIEDEPTAVDRSRPGVRREEYRRLFSRLRHG
jgi:type II secretory pathway predicted ATPase ExeA